jgi:putative transposase
MLLEHSYAAPMETGRQTFEYKLTLTPAHEQALWRVLHACRFLYNCALEQRKAAWKYHHVSITRFQQEAELQDIRAEMPEYAAIHSHMLQDVLARLDKAFQAFFRRVQAGEKAGYPRFQGINRYHSLTFKEYGNRASLDNGFLVLSKIGRIAVRWGRPLEGTPKTVTISHEADGWYFSFSCAEVPCQPLPPTGRDIGIDLGLTSFLTISEGLQVANPRWLRKKERKLKWHQRRVSRRKPGSKRRTKAVRELAACHQTARRQRADFHYKEALKLARENDVIYHDDLEVRNMVRNKHLSKSISDAGWAAFLAILSFKAGCAGREVVAVPAQYTQPRL